MDRYIGLDAHSSTGKRLHSQVVETNAKALIQVVELSGSVTLLFRWEWGDDIDAGRAVRAGSV
jgi:hypothetical protein